MDIIQKELIQRLEKGLNEISQDKQFKFYIALGDYEDAYREGNNEINFIQGVSGFLPTTLIPLKGVQMFRTTAEIEIAVDVDAAYLNETGDYQNILDIIQGISDYAMSVQASPYYETINNIQYQIIPFFTLPTNDMVVMQTSNRGEVIPINFSVEYLVTANLVAADSYRIYIDGQEVNFESLVVTRNRVADQYSTNGLENTESIILQGGLGIDMTLPQFLNTTGDLVLSDVFKGENNTAHYVRFERPTSTGDVIENYIMIFGNNQSTMQKASNVGLNISLVEGITYTLNYDSSWKFETVDSYTKSYTVSQPTVFFWGDGTSDYVKSGIITHDYPDISVWNVIYKISN